MALFSPAEGSQQNCVSKFCGLHFEIVAVMLYHVSDFSYSDSTSKT